MNGKRAPGRSLDEWLELVISCRQSGFSDYQWCEQNGIHLGTFYNWVSKLRKSGYALPDSSKKSEMKLSASPKGSASSAIVYVGRHIVGGENRTLISVLLPLRLCRIGTYSRFLA